MTITSVAPIVSSTGISAPTFAQILAYYTQQFQNIYGADVYLGNDSQDGQWLGVLAQAQNDTNNVAISVYNSFNPTTAQGVSLSNNVKLNALTREVANYSTVDLVLIGVWNSTITSGIVMDSNSNQWALPFTVTFPESGTITVTAECTTIGAIQAEADTITTIITPQLGWQSANNPAAANPGAAVETDAELRIRQANSTMNGAVTIPEAILGSIGNLPNVTAVSGVNNPTGSTNSQGVPAHSISVVVSGGDVNAIASTIANKKGPGCGTYGSTNIAIVNQFGIPETINFYVTQVISVTVNITLTPLANYTTAIGIEIQNAVSAYVNALPNGAKIMASKLYSPANLTSPDGDTFEITALTITGGTPDLQLLFYQQASCPPVNVVITT